MSRGAGKRFENASEDVEGKDESSGGGTGSPSAVGAVGCELVGTRCNLLDVSSTPTRWRGASMRERKRSTTALTNAV